MGLDYFRPGPPPAPEPPPKRDRYRGHHRNDVDRRRPPDEDPSADAYRLPEMPIDDELVRRRRIESGIAFLASEAGRPYREDVNAVRDFGGDVGPNWVLTPSNEVKCWEGTAPSNPAIDLRRAIVAFGLHAADVGEIAVGKAFELTFPMLLADDVETMWQSFRAWRSDPQNLADEVALPGDWATDKDNQFKPLLFGRPIYIDQDAETIRLRINGFFKVRDRSGSVRNVIPSKKAFVDWCLVLHEGSPGKASSRMIAHDIPQTQPAFQQQVGIYRNSKFHEGRVERFDSTAPMVVNRIDVLPGGTAKVELVANVFRLVMNNAHVRRRGNDEVLFADGENVTIHFRIGSLQCYWQGVTGSFFFTPIETPDNWTASGNWILKEAGSKTDLRVSFPEQPNETEMVDYSVAVPWMRQLVNSNSLPVGLLAHFMVNTLLHFPHPFDLSWKPQLVGVSWGSYA